MTIEIHLTRSRRFARVLSLCTLTLLTTYCARSPIRNVEQAMRPAKEMPSLRDDLEPTTLIKGLEANLQQLRSLQIKTPQLRFGPRTIPTGRYIAAVESLLMEAKADPTGEKFRQALRANFEPFEVYGQEDWGQVFMTSYFEPVIEGSKTPTERFTQPLYGVPKNMVMIDLMAFANSRPTLAPLKAAVLEQRSQSSFLRGQLIEPEKPNELKKIVPFPSRAEINSGLLKGQAQELVWVDPIDGFFLEIQGSGVVKLADGSELKVGYAAQNGHPYVAVGKYLLDVIPKEKMTMQTIEAHLRSLPSEEAFRIMNLNPSYVFFQPLANAGLTYFGTEVVPGRTIATDQTYFPKGTLAFLEFDRPVFAHPGDITPTSWVKASRFVLDQDTGGAIRGPHRVDLFWGRGPEAKQAAGVMKNKGRLVYFVPK